jgi:hypothetical protein
MDTQSKDGNLPIQFRWGISFVCLVLLGADLVLGIPQRHGFSSFEAVLVLAGAAPWLIGVIEVITFGGATLKLRIDKNESDIETLKFLVELAVSKYELRCLFSLRENIPFMTNTADRLDYDGAFKPAILRLRGHELLRNRRDTGFPQLESEPKGPRDGRDHFELTEKGRRYLAEYERTRGRPLRAEDFTS